MAHSLRIFYSGVEGTVRRNHNWPFISQKSAVIITAAEFFWPGGFGGLEDIRPSLGAAPIWVSNVGAHGNGSEAGGVEFLLHVDWGSPLNVMVTITVLDDIQQYDRVG
ncbi:hypothetical protein [Kitasatospora sp. NPDC057541]|uniref:hypothetical protein n=1 Tax=unclassified Kitasatospora TaxID=2633591 RepID=UPI0036B13FF4